ncbi:unnamed protein product [Rotaria socialis]|uniref:Uncharacterized protein n=1 Tax=Rotaria socialis TaxID=392032 RepID=A0A820T4G4_9BILA|nr:unnamed protein product [Rotaria socialis]CAF4258623.1 unnamed protein product [Rotaria socialis]CAF4462708.1 unnamed protein product [Rotaria socialis]CAF4483329.1 unnamed protein product [Rotaria socialis]CAF4689125.1 unnamed protein product [Rotaria socialis]
MSKLDRDIAYSFLNAPSDSISYLPMEMVNDQNHIIMAPSQSVIQNDPRIDDILSQYHPKDQFGVPTNTNIIPMYYDVVIDTVTDYDISEHIFYPIAKQTTKYYNNWIHDQPSISNNQSTYPRCHVERLDELAVSVDFSRDYDLTSAWSNQYQYERANPIKNVRFNDHPKSIPYSRNTYNPMDQYYFYPERISQIDNEQASVRYLTTPFFWFRPVLNHNYAICIPRTRPSLHTFITSSFDRLPIQYQTNSTPNPIRL